MYIYIYILPDITVYNPYIPPIKLLCWVRLMLGNSNGLSGQGDELWQLSRCQLTSGVHANSPSTDHLLMATLK